MELLQAIALALVQGVTAWIPVSSKTQVVLAGTAFFAIPFKTCLAYALLLHLGDLLAALWKYRREYAGALLQFKKPAALVEFDRHPEEKFLITSIAATAIVALPLYIILRKAFAGLQGELLLAAVGALLLAMAAVTLFSRRKNAVGAAAPVTLKTAIATGFAQGLAVVPGVSRSGITQCALLLQGIPPEKAVRLSFLMAAPMIAAAFAAFWLVEGFEGFGAVEIIAGIAVSAVASLLTMDFVTKIARKLPSHAFLAAVGLLALVPLALKLAGAAG